MKFKNFNLLNLISLFTTVACIALCFQGCLGNQGSTPQPLRPPQLPSPPPPIGDGIWELSSLDPLPPSNSDPSPRSVHDRELLRIHTQFTNRAPAGTPFIKLQIRGNQGEIRFDLSANGAQCLVTSPFRIVYSRKHCGCPLITLHLEGIQESHEECASQAIPADGDHPALTLNSLFDLFNAQFGITRHFLYLEGDDTFSWNEVETSSPTEDTPQSTFNFNFSPN